ncbi:MAG: hypothetical protein JW967_11520 [Dehalococcoidales bacterium]|nr:hypothetical protein [Dehalococcoidales bacterium]
MGNSIYDKLFFFGDGEYREKWKKIDAPYTSRSAIGLGNEWIKGSMHIGFRWILPGGPYPPTKAHTHDADEVIGFIGSNTDDVTDLGGEVELFMGEEMERYVISKTCLVWIPKDLVHCPMTYLRIDRPLLFFIAEASSFYKQQIFHSSKSV